MKTYTYLTGMLSPELPGVRNSRWLILCPDNTVIITDNPSVLKSYRDYGTSEGAEIRELTTGQAEKVLLALTHSLL